MPEDNNTLGEQNDMCEYLYVVVVSFVMWLRV